jgi:hypothetical protein
MVHKNTITGNNLAKKWDKISKERTFIQRPQNVENTKGH